MMDIQQRLFEAIRPMVPRGANLVDEIMQALSLSSDSAYRRLRGDTLLNVDEIAKLCSRYDLSFDEFLDSSAKRVSFQFQPIKEDVFDFRQYLQYIERMMARIASASDKQMLYLANDIPLFHLLAAPAIASFKLFIWQRTILDFASFRNKLFDLGEIDEFINTLSRRIRNHYFVINSKEIYSPETVDITLKQIQYYHDSSLFADPEHALLLCDSLLQLVDHLQFQCEHEVKCKPSESEFVAAGDKHKNYRVLHNEILFTDATILVKADDEYFSYLTNNGLNVLSTRDRNFYDENLRAFEVLERKSTVISGSNERQRNKVFSTYRQKINRVKTRLEADLVVD